MRPSPPTYFWIVSILAVLWNIFGVLSFLGHVMLPESMKASMSQEELTLHDSYPTWTYVIFAIATFAGLIGSILLLCRLKLAHTILLVSLIAVVIQMGHSLLLTDSLEVYGAVHALLMPTLIIAIAIYLYVFSKKGIRNAWLA